MQRTRLLGSAADEGLAEAVFQLEAEWETPVRRAAARARPQRRVRDSDRDARPGGFPCKGKADRIDLLADGTFRIIDYKLGRAPDRKLALQLPIYTVCTVQHLRETTGEELGAGSGGLHRLRRRSPVRADARRAARDKDAMLRRRPDAPARAVDAIERGEFPPTPADIMMCARCAHVAVCRKDYVGDV